VKSFLLLAAFVLPGILPAAAQNPPPPMPVPRVQSTPPPLTRFDLDFPGGTPGQFVKAVSKALGKNVNVIISPADVDQKIIPAIKMEKVTVADLFRAIEVASSKSIAVPSGAQGGTPSYRNVSIGFRPGTPSNEGYLVDESTWAFISSYPTPEDVAFYSRLEKSSVPVSEDVCYYFQLAPYLDDYTIEDITTAIQTGWKMLNAEPLPQLSFHKETKLLIAVGSERNVTMIAMVLDQLVRNGSLSVERVAALEQEIADLEEQKPAGWEKLVDEKRLKIYKIAMKQKARAAIEAPVNPASAVPQAPGTPRRIIRQKPVNSN
jgi:hypothetical protein